MGQDGFQDFDRKCRHAENTAAFTRRQAFVVFVSFCSKSRRTDISTEENEGREEEANDSSRRKPVYSRFRVSV
jgi:hypothetical protein